MSGLRRDEMDSKVGRGGCRPPSLYSSIVPSPSPVLPPPIFNPLPSLLFFPSPLKFSKEVRGSTLSLNE